MNAAWNVVVSSYQMSIVPDRLLGRVGSAIQLLGAGAAAVGPALLGLLLTRIGGVNTTWLLALGAALLAATATVAPVLRQPLTGDEAVSASD